jgi:RimJ/RimL family protein N-acetyltransferase
MKLEMMTAADAGIRVRAETDPQMMSELGGPRPREDIERAHATSLALAAEGKCWPLKVMVDGVAAGAVVIWESSHAGQAIYEIGWLILPEFQGRGLASQAVRETLAKARAERKFGQIHAFPAVTNIPSNKVCERSGFGSLGECDVEFGGRQLRCNHWQVEVSPPLATGAPG